MLRFLESFSKHGSFHILCDSFFNFSFLSLIVTMHDCEGFRKSSPINLIVYSDKNNINKKYYSSPI